MDNDQLKETLQQYGALKVQEKAIKAELEKLNPVIKEALISQGLDKAEVAEVGEFTIKKVKVWKFSDTVSEAEEAVDELKKDEKANGVATFDIRNDLMFTSK